jgi:hypothetical protein
MSQVWDARSVVCEGDVNIGQTQILEDVKCHLKELGFIL